MLRPTSRSSWIPSLSSKALRKKIYVRLWHQADIQPIASLGLVPAEKQTCLISVWNDRL